MYDSCKSSYKYIWHDLIHIIMNVYIHEKRKTKYMKTHRSGYAYEIRKQTR